MNVHLTLLTLLVIKGCGSQSPRKVYREIEVKEGDILTLGCNVGGNLTSIPPSLTQEFRDGEAVQLYKSGVYVCREPLNTIIHYVHVTGADESNECGLMLPITTDQHTLTVKEHSNVTLPCIAFGRGIDISLEITKDCKPQESGIPELKVAYVPKVGFMVSDIHKNLQGAWQCVAQREKCKQIINFSVQVSPGFPNFHKNETLNKDTDKAPLLIFGIVFFTLILVGWISCLVCWIIRRKRRSARLTSNDIRWFMEGAVETINPELGLDQQADLLPYDVRYEFPRENLRLGKQLGSGEFGRVVKAQARGSLYGAGPRVPGQAPLTTVAVKLLRPQAELAHLKALMTELKILIHVGKHLNVVSLLGACTTNLRNNGLLVIVEYCRFGNLHSFLIQARERFIDQLNHQQDIYDFIIENDFDSEKPYNNLSPETGEVVMTEEEAAIALYDLGPNCNLTTNVEKTEPRTSSFELLESKQRGDFRAVEVWDISSKDLICWAYQVARGMEYLASRQIVHADLAARNLLLAENNVIKICDFGLSRNLYRHANYRKKTAGPLPVRWLALESLQDGIFSTRSDVWSFGIVLWEFFSLARTPYPGIMSDEIFVTRIREGYRMEKPQYSSSEMYAMMEHCWQAIPANRPDFSELAQQLANMLEEKSKKLYLELLDSWTEDAQLMEDAVPEIDVRKSKAI